MFWSRRPTADERAASPEPTRAADLRMVATYPRGLAIAIVRRDGAVEQFWRWRMLVDRDNPLLLAREFMRIGSDLVEVHLPEVDVEHLRTRFRSNRQPLEALPTT